ncbi:MAG: trypsin-like peptidase domain-containing protein [Cytophagales bacterium]
MFKRYLFITIVAICSGFVGSWIYQKFFNESTSYIVNQNQIPIHQTSTLHANISNESFIKASALSTPSVVYIKTISSNEQNSQNWMDFFFNNRQGGQEISSGSGVIYSKNGYIVTNNHVINNASKIEVIHNKRTYSGKIIGTDPSTDLAVIKIEAQNLPAIQLGNSRNINVGEWVLAVGNPFNLTSTVTAGIVSAKGRDIDVVKSRFPLESFIQTDAAINPGNSGGALVNINGELIGVNTAILSRTGSYTGYGFAVPVDIVNKVVKDIIEFGIVQKAFLGVNVSDNNAGINDNSNKSVDGVVVGFVDSDGAAAKIGIVKGDIITAVNGIAVNTKSEFDEQISYYRPGDKVKIQFKRDDKSIEGTATLTNLDGSTGVVKNETYKSETLGAEFDKVSKLERDKLKIDSGVRLAKVYGGLFAQLGIEEGFIITSVNNVKITTPQILEEVLKKANGRVVIEGINSQGSKGYYSYFF